MNPSCPSGDSPDAMQPSTRVLTILLAILSTAAMFWLLRETFTVMMPVVFALLLALGVWPIIDFVQGRLPRWLRWVAPLVGMLFIVAILFAFLVGLGLSLQQLYNLGTDLAPIMKERFLGSSLTDAFPVGDYTNLDDFASQGALISTGLTALDITTSTVAGLLLILFLTLLMLTEAENWRQKVSAISEGSTRTRWLSIGRSVGQKFRAYFATRFIIGLITAALNVGWLALFGVDYLLLWGVLAVLLNFIPTVGSIIAGILPVTYVLLTRDLLSASYVAIGLFAIEQIMGNFLDPKIMGKRLAISPLVVLVSLLLWSLVWSVPGAFLAVPLTVLITMVMAHFDRFKPFALLLTDCSSMDDLEQYTEPG